MQIALKGIVVLIVAACLGGAYYVVTNYRELIGEDFADIPDDFLKPTVFGLTGLTLVAVLFGLISIVVAFKSANSVGQLNSPRTYWLLILMLVVGSSNTALFKRFRTQIDGTGETVASAPIAPIDPEMGFALIGFVAVVAVVVGGFFLWRWSRSTPDAASPQSTLEPVEENSNPSADAIIERYLASAAASPERRKTGSNKAGSGRIGSTASNGSAAFGRRRTDRLQSAR